MEQMDMNSTFDDVIFPMTSIKNGTTEAYADDVYMMTVQFVNVYFVGTKGSWVLIDAGLPKSAEKIIEAAENLFGEGCRPTAILLTHGHFDHVGAIIELIQHWKTDVYAHQKEMDYLTGAADYPAGDDTVDGGLISELSPLFPHRGIDLGTHIQALPEDGAIPGMGDWRWIPTPGHTPGHVSFFRERDRVLLAGDAFVTVKQESIYKVFLQIQEISGPPKYFTMDWAEAKESVKRLEALKPHIAITGHGTPMSGERLSSDLKDLVLNFDQTAIPRHGKFVN